MSSGKKYFFTILIEKKDLQWGMCIGIGSIKYNFESTIILGLKEIDCNDSWGWLPYNGKSKFLHHSRDIKGFNADPFVEGDKLRMIVDTKEKTLTYYRNGQLVGTPFIRINSEKIIPIVTLCGPKDKIRILPTYK